MKIYIINGQGGVGKTTFEKFCGDFIPSLISSTIDPIKEIAKIVGWNEEKTQKDRKFLSDLKYLCNKYNNYSLNYIKTRIEYAKKSNKKVIFIDCREPYEIDILKKTYKAKTILIRNKRIKNNFKNKSDSDVEKYKYDYIINNNSDLTDLYTKVKIFLKKEGLI